MRSTSAPRRYLRSLSTASSTSGTAALATSPSFHTVYSDAVEAMSTGGGSSSGGVGGGAGGGWGGYVSEEDCFVDATDDLSVSGGGGGARGPPALSGAQELASLAPLGGDVGTQLGGRGDGGWLQLHHGDQGGKQDVDVQVTGDVAVSVAGDVTGGCASYCDWGCVLV